MLLTFYYQLHNEVWNYCFLMLHNFFRLPALSESFSFKNICFFATIHFNGSYLAFLYNSLSICSLAFLKALKSLSLKLSVSNSSPLNQSWVFPLIGLVLQGVISSMTVINFWSLNTTNWHLQNIRSLDASTTYFLIEQN